jgi:hypothetical protein
MPLANYTTKVPVAQTLTEIQHMLVKHGAQAFMIEYAGTEPSACCFRITRGQIAISFRLPCDWRAALKVLEAEHAISYSAPRPDKEARAQRVAWRVCRDWLRAQLALVEIGAAKLEQVMLPYALTANGQTLYDRLEARGFDSLALPAPPAD